MISFNFKNDKERRRFLNEYQNWGVWFVEPNTNVTYYGCKLPDGHYIVVEKQPDIIRKYGSVEFPVRRERYHLYEGDYNMLESRGTPILDVLHKMQGIYNIETSEELNYG